MTKVDKQIEISPNSPNDDRIHAAVYAAICSSPPPQKYAVNRRLRSTPSVTRAAGWITNGPPIGYHAIHIIVRNGNVTLTGVVNNESDMAIAGIPGQWSSPSVQRRQPAPSGNPVVGSGYDSRESSGCPRHEFAHTSSARNTPASRLLLTVFFLPSRPRRSLASPGRRQ